MLTPRPYQERGIQFGLSHPANFKMVDLGLGKTMMELFTIKYTKTPTIIFAPLRVVYMTWPDEIAKWTPELSYTILHGPKKDERLKLNRDIYLINYDGIKWFYLACLGGKFPLRKYRFVFDESSWIKDPSTQRFKFLRKMKSIISKNRSCLSATPAPNGYHELWSQYYMLDEGARLGPYFTPFRDKYFMYYPPPQNRTIPLPFAEIQIQETIRDITFRLDAKDHLQLPPTVFNPIVMELPAKLRKIYDKFREEMTLQFSATESASAFFSAALNNKCRQFLQGAVYLDEDKDKPVKRYMQLHDIKAQALKELCESLPGKNILACFQYRFELEIINKVFKQKLPYIAGGISAAESTTILRRWNAGQIPLLLVHPASVSHGLNLQSAGHTLVWVALTWSLEQYQQTIGRLARQGQEHTVTVHNLVFKNTVDYVLSDVLAKKGATQQDLLDALKGEFNAG